MRTEYTLPATLTQKIADYLAERPFKEVYLLLQELIKTIQEQTDTGTGTGTEASDVVEKAGKGG